MNGLDKKEVQRFSSAQCRMPSSSLSVVSYQTDRRYSFPIRERGSFIARPTSCYDSAVPNISSVMRYAWSAPTTVLGVVLVLAGLWRVHVRIVDGVIEAHGPTLAWLLSHLTIMPGGAAALTLGHVVVGRDLWSLESTRAHERVHVRQCEVWGLLFVPAYLAASLSAVLRGRDFYFGNRFEVAAYHAARNQPTSEGPPLGIASQVTP
jgi:hypothetical protein